MENITQKIETIKERQKSRIDEKKLLIKIEKLAKQRARQQRAIEKLDTKLEDHFKMLESLEIKGA